MQSNILNATRSSALLAELASFASEGASISVTRSVDCSLVKLSDDAKYLVALATFVGGVHLISPDALTTLRNIPKHILKQVSYTFMVVCDIETSIALRQKTPLNCLHRSIDGNFFLLWVTGTLFDWWWTITEFADQEETFDLRFLMDKALLLFETKFGLGELWSSYQKKHLPDKTFYLEKE